MNFIKRASVYLLIIFLFISIYNDLNGKTQITEESNSNHHNNNIKFTIMHIKVQPGDTVLTIVEEINSNKFSTLDINQILSDFQEINPTVDPYSIQPHSFYYFPKYYLQLR